MANWADACSLADRQDICKGNTAWPTMLMHAAVRIPEKYMLFKEVSWDEETDHNHISAGDSLYR